MSGPNLVRLGGLALIWGASFLLIKLALEGLSPMQIVLGRLTAGALVLLGALVVQRLPLPRDPTVWLHLVVMGLVANIIPFFLFGWGELRITSGLAGVLNGTAPLFTLAFAAVALPEERLHRVRSLGLVVGFVGVVLVVGPWDANPLTSSVPGQLACLAAAACYGVAFPYTRRFLSRRGYRPMVLAAGQLGAATVTLWLASPLLARGPVDLTPMVLGSTLALGAVGTGIAYLLYYRLITDAGATSASMVAYLIPVVAVVLGVLVLSEPVTWNLFVGAAVVIAGVATAEGRLPGMRRRALVAAPRSTLPGSRR